MRDSGVWVTMAMSPIMAWLWNRDARRDGGERRSAEALVQDVRTRPAHPDELMIGLMVRMLAWLVPMAGVVMMMPVVAATAGGIDEGLSSGGVTAWLVVLVVTFTCSGAAVLTGLRFLLAYVGIHRLAFLRTVDAGPPAGRAGPVQPASGWLRRAATWLRRAAVRLARVLVFPSHLDLPVAVLVGVWGSAWGFGEDLSLVWDLLGFELPL